jgi:NADPH2:quinone reductase
MQTIQVMRFGGPDVLQPNPGAEPVAGAGQALVAVEVADVLTLDAALRAGDGSGFFDLRPPYVPGGGVAGRVLATGDARDTDWVGRRVVARLGQQGACAERVAAPVETLVEIPEGLGSVDAAALVHDGLTARGLLEAAAVRPGERVLVTAAAGAMGVLLVQDLLRAGATVVGAIRGAAKRGVVQDLGAAPVDYDDPRGPGGRRGRRRALRRRPGRGGRPGRARGVRDRRRRRALLAHGAPSGDFAPVAEEEATARGVACGASATSGSAPMTPGG